MTDGSQGALAERIDAIEEAYEFMLAYAAQGREDEHGPGESIRDFLGRFATALDGLEAAAAGEAKSLAGTADPAWRDFLAQLGRDAEQARIVLGLVLAQRNIASSLIDNVNASIHVRTLLTDLFLVDEALKAGRAR